MGEELDDKDKALEGALKWSVSKVTSAQFGQSMPFLKKSFFMDFDTRNDSLHKEPFRKSPSLCLTKIRVGAIKSKALTEMNI